MTETPKPAEVRRIGRYLHRITPVFDNTGKLIHYAVTPLMVELHPRDVAQIIVGASIMAIPTALTGEAWQLGMELPLPNIFGLLGISLAFITVFVYTNVYRGQLKEHRIHFVVRVLVTYGLSALVVATLLTLLEQCPWGVDNVTAVKRIILVTLPASLSGALSDTLR